MKLVLIVLLLVGAALGQSLPADQLRQTPLPLPAPRPSDFDIWALQVDFHTRAVHNALVLTMDRVNQDENAIAMVQLASAQCSSDSVQLTQMVVALNERVQKLENELNTLRRTVRGSRPKRDATYR